MVERKDDEFVHKVVKQFYAQQAPKKYVVRMPCHDISLEVPKGAEGWFTCPKRGCGKRYLLTNNMVNKRLYAE